MRSLLPIQAQTTCEGYSPAKEADIDRERRRVWLAERLKEKAENESPNARLLCGRFVDGRTNVELAAAEGLTEKAVESRICRRIRELRHKAEENGLMVPNHEGDSSEEKKEKSEKVARDFDPSSD